MIAFVALRQVSLVSFSRAWLSFRLVSFRKILSGKNGPLVQQEQAKVFDTVRCLELTAASK